MLFIQQPMKITVTITETTSKQLDTDLTSLNDTTLNDSSLRLTSPSGKGMYFRQYCSDSSCFTFDGNCI